MTGFRKILPKEIEGNFFSLLDDSWMLVTAGTLGEFNTMTASWGGFGQLWYKPVAFVFIRPQRYTYEFTESNEVMTLSFFGDQYRKALTYCGTNSGRDVDKAAGTGLTPLSLSDGGVTFSEANIVIECRKMYADMIRSEGFYDKNALDKSYPDGTFHKMYVCEITAVWIKE